MFRAPDNSSDESEISEWVTEDEDEDDVEGEAFSIERDGALAVDGPLGLFAGINIDDAYDVDDAAPLHRLPRIPGVEESTVRAFFRNFFEPGTEGTAVWVVNLANAVRDGIIPVKTFLGFHQGWDVNVDDRNGHTELCTACQMNSEFAVRLLVERLGADPDLVDDRGKAPIEFAASRNAIGIATVLIASGASVTPKTLFVACSTGQVHFARWLLREGHCAIPLQPTGRDLMKRIAELGLYFQHKETVQEWEERAERGVAFASAVQAAGSYAAFFAEPRYELVLLRALCLSGRAKSRHEQLFKWMTTTPPTLQTASGKKRAKPKPTSVRCYYLATRLFGAGQEQELPLGCFEKVLDFWWRG